MKGHIKRGPSDQTWYLRAELSSTACGKRRQRRKTVHGTKAEAQRQLRDFLREIESGGYADGTRMTIADIGAKWLETTQHRVGIKTYKSYASHVRLYIAPALGVHKAESLRPAHIESALAQWSRNGRNDLQTGSLSQRTIAHIFNTLKTMCRWAVKMGIIIRNPVDAVKSPKVDRHEMNCLNPAGVASLMHAAKDTGLEYAIIVAIGTGLRRGELLALQWSDIDFENGRLSVRRAVETVDRVIRTKPTKTARSTRTISMPGFVADSLQRCRAEQNKFRMHLGLGRGSENGWVFTHQDQSQWEPGAFSLGFARMVAKAKLPHIRFHDLRHTFGTLALTSGVDLKTISSALGHSNISVTANTYLHAVDSLHRDAADRIDALLGPAMNGVTSNSVPQAFHEAPQDTKKPRRSRVELVAPTGIEPVFTP